jgi:deazaflavin-dependent oxidoreductase (nitroreductase family)
MANISSDSIQPPRGLLLLGFRLPVWFYRLGLGLMMGKRFIYFEHIGRKSGLLRRTVVEIVRYDPIADIYFIVSGYGEKADWYKNIIKAPKVKAQVGGRRFNAIAERLSQERALAEFQDYHRRNPNALKYLGSMLLGLQITGTEEELLILSQILPVMAIKVV